MDKKLIISLGIIIIFIFLFIKPVISGDGFGYYAQLEAMFGEGTTNLENQVKYNDFFGGEIIKWNETTQQYTTRYSSGLAIFSAPLYVITLFLDDIPFFHIKDEYFIKERGDILIHQLGLTMTSLIFVFIALIFTLFILRELNFLNPELIMLLTFFGTPLIFYATYGLSYSHAVEAGLMAVLVFLMVKKPHPTSMGVFVGLLTLIRYTSGMFAIPFIVYYLFKKKFRELGLFLLGMIPFGIYILIYNINQFGLGNAFFGYDGSIVFAFHIFDVLFHLERGFLVWTPLILLSLIGLFYLRSKTELPINWMLISFFVSYLLFYGIITAWHGSWSFGNRYFTVFFPLFAIGIASFIQKFGKLKLLVYALAIYSLSMFLLFVGAMGHIPDPYMLSSNFKFWISNGNFIKLIIEKISFVRFFNG